MSNRQAVLTQTPIESIIMRVKTELSQSSIAGKVHIVTEENHATIEQNEGMLRIQYPGDMPFDGNLTPLMDSIFNAEDTAGFCVRSEATHRELKARGTVKHKRGDFLYIHNNGRAYHIF
jgi:hypothetical protein